MVVWVNEGLRKINNRIPRQLCRGGSRSGRANTEIIGQRVGVPALRVGGSLAHGDQSPCYGTRPINRAETRGGWVAGFIRRHLLARKFISGRNRFLRLLKQASIFLQAPCHDPGIYVRALG